jgi:hypothetical protein
MNFDELFKYCNNLNEDQSEKCLVCHIPVGKSKEYLKLKCNHIFHPDCIKYKMGKINCLYCEKISIPNLINNKLFEEQTQSIEIKQNKNNTESKLHCSAIIKSGIFKGKQCGRTHCKYHKQEIQMVEQENDIDICKSIIKKGLRMGQECGRTNCSYHNKIDKNIIEI